jgi:hypothetical protein
VPAAWGEWKSSGAAHDAEFIAHANADIAYLLAERSRLAGENAELRQPPTDPRALYVQLRDAIAALQSENAALRKDAERIARLEALGDFRVSEPRNSADAWEIRRDELSAGDLLRSVTIGYGADLRDAIDDTPARLPADPGGRE